MLHVYTIAWNPIGKLLCCLPPINSSNFPTKGEGQFPHLICTSLVYTEGRGKALFLYIIIMHQYCIIHGGGQGIVWCDLLRTHNMLSETDCVWFISFPGSPGLISGESLGTRLGKWYMIRGDCIKFSGVVISDQPTIFVMEVICMALDVVLYMV